MRQERNVEKGGANDKMCPPYQNLTKKLKHTTDDSNNKNKGVVKL